MFLKIGLIFILIGFCILLLYIFPKFDEKPMLATISLYSVAIGIILLIIGAFIDL